MNILQLKKYYLLIKSELQNKFIDSALGKTFEKQAKISKSKKKIRNKQELQHIAFNHLSDIEFKDFMNLSKKCTAKLYSFFSY